MCESCSFTHLHAHSEHSSLDGLSKIKELFKTAKSLGQTALAITDHGTTAGLWEAQCVADELGMKAILGIEFYYERENDGKNGHLLVLAKNNTGLSNIFKMQKWASKENFYYKPRINFDVLKEHSEGLIVSSACLGSAFNQYLMKGEYEEAKAWARKFQAVFGEDFYIEIQPNQVPEQFITNRDSVRIARELGIKIIATNDVHYTYEDDCFPHEVLLAMQKKAKMSDEKRFKFDTTDFWLKSEGEMYETFTGLDNATIQEAINNTREIADKCNARIEKGKFLPTFYNIPEGKTERKVLVEKIIEGSKSRGLSTNREYMQDVQNEIDVIDRNGYCGYFLVVQDYVEAAKQRHDLVGDGRGSGAGSKVAYNIGITEIPPHEYDLLFERFMSGNRSPDFDVDFSNQQAVFRDLQEKYGFDNVSRIIAYGKMKPKAVIRKVFSTFEHPTHIINPITKLVPDLCETMEEAYQASPELLKYKDKYRVEWGVIERLAGVISHTSMHAGGVLIYEGLSEIAPLKYNSSEDIYVVEWDKVALEEIGHYKFDVLGLETLPVINDAKQSILQTTGNNIDLYNLDWDDPKVYDMLCDGDVSGVFQLANQAAKVMEQKPRNFRDLIAINALIRPGVGDWHEYIARRNGKSWTVLPERMPYLQETQGTMTYQEQFLLDCKYIAGWDIAYADKHVRKNKNIREDSELANQFMNDSLERGFKKEDIQAIWNEIMDAVDGGYSFNKSHSASYARMSFQTAYLKCYYPEHFYAALMSGEKTDGDGQNAISGYIAECKQRGIPIIPPHINESGENFKVVDGKIAYRITTIKHVGGSAIRAINELRPFSDFDDFIARRIKSDIKKNVVINLVKAGAFDFDNPNRAELLWKFDMLSRTKTEVKEGYQCPPYEWDDKVKAEWEMEVLGTYLSVHPLQKYGFKALVDYPDGDQCLQGGEVYDLVQIKDKKGNDMAFAFINTLFGNVKILLFSQAWARKDTKELFQIGNIVLVRGKRSGDAVMYNSGEVLT